MSEQSETHGGEAAFDVNMPARRWTISRFLLSGKNAQVRHLSQSVRLEESRSPRIALTTAFVISATVLLFLLWAGVTNINEVTRSPGEFVPLGLEQVVEHNDGGLVAEILVEDGMLVEKGQLLAILDGAGIQEDLSRFTRKQGSLDLRAERLRAFVKGREPMFELVANVTTKEVADHRDVFDAMIAARHRQADIIRDQIAQKRKGLDILAIRGEATRANVAALQEIYDAYKALHEKGHTTLIKMTDLQLQLTTLKSEEASLAGLVHQAESAISEFETRLRSLGSSQRDESYRELADVESELAQNQQVIEKLTRRVERLHIFAPERGVVKGLKINTIGSVIEPGQEIMSIVPLDRPLVVETKIRPRDIGHVRVGQQAKIKLSAYDYQIYGALTGRIDFVSAATFKDENGFRHYRARLSFDPADATQGRFAIIPGMTVMAEVITGEKTILEYLLKPIQRALSSAFSER